MSAAPESDQTNPTANSCAKYSIGHPSGTACSTDPDAADNSNTTTAFLFRQASQPQPNEQFYCVDAESGREDLVVSKSVRQQQRQEEETQEDLSCKKIAEVAAAARFISKVDFEKWPDRPDNYFPVPPRPRLGSSTSIRDSILDSALHVPKSRPHKSHVEVPTRRRATRPPPLQLKQVGRTDDGVQSPLPTRTSSKGAPSFDVIKSPDSAKFSDLKLVSPSMESESARKPLPVLTPERAKTFDFDFDFPTEPRLSRSASGATTDSRSPPTPPNGPTEDQILREIEAFALEQGPFLRGSDRRPRRPPILDTKKETTDVERPSPPVLLESGEDARYEGAAKMEDRYNVVDTETAPTSPLPRKRSIFGWLQKRPEVEVDDLLDLYLTDEQRDDTKPLETRTLSHRSSKSRTAVFRNRVVTDPIPGKNG